MNKEQLLKMLSAYNDGNLISVRISGTNKHLKIINVDDSCDVGMVEIVVEPFTNERNYYSETMEYAKLFNTNYSLNKLEESIEEKCFIVNKELSEKEIKEIEELYQKFEDKPEDWKVTAEKENV